MNCSSNFKLKLSHYFIIYKQNNRGCLIYPGNIGNPILMQKKHALRHALSFLIFIAVNFFISLDNGHDTACRFLNRLIGHVNNRTMELSHNFLGIGKLVFNAVDIRIIGRSRKSEGFHSFTADGI